MAALGCAAVRLAPGLPCAPPCALDAPAPPPSLGANCTALAEFPRGCLDSSHPSSPVGVAAMDLSADNRLEKSDISVVKPPSDCAAKISLRGLDTPFGFLVYYAPKALRKDPRGEKDGARRDKPCAEHERKRSDEREKRKQGKRRTRRSVRAVREQDGRRMADGGGGRVRLAVRIWADPRGGLL